MARGGAVTKGPHENGDIPPPSTLAAQIVQTAAPAAQQNGETQSFAALLHEILHNHAATVETDIETNATLVKVVAEAGLAPLTGENPFASWDVIIPQAVDSVAVIEATIKRQPGILFARSTPDEPQTFLPLLVRLLAVCGRPKCEVLPIRRLLDSLLQALDSSTELWRQAKTDRDIIQDCVDDVLSSLEAAIRSKVPFNVKLPPARCIARLWPGSEKAIALPHGCQTTISDQSHGFMLALELGQVSRLSAPWREQVQRTLQRLWTPSRLSLKASKQDEASLLTLLVLSYNLPALSYVLRECATGSISVELQTRAAQRLVDAIRDDIDTIHNHLLYLIWSLASSKAFEQLHEDLKIAIVTIISRLCKQELWPGQVQALHDALRQDNVMTDSKLQTAFQELSVTKKLHSNDRLRSRKRRKVEHSESEDQRKAQLRQTINTLTGVQVDGFGEFADVAPNLYRSMSEAEQDQVWQILIDLAEIDVEAATKAVKAIIDDPALPSTKRNRVLGMLAVQACLDTTTGGAELDLANSSFGQLCLCGLQSSVRELRVAAGRCLKSFLRGAIDSKLRNANGKVVLEYLRALSDRGLASEQDTLVSAWAQVARVGDDAELNLCLLRLVDYLGHSNSLISGLAFTELELIAETKGLSASDLFKPFWNSIAVLAVQDLHSRPQKAQQLSQLVEMDVNQLLLHTQQESIPALVVTRKREILQRIANARGQGTSVQDLLLQPRTNLMATLAVLLTQPGSNPEESAMACLTDVAPNLRGTDLADLVKIDSTLLACNMLKYTGDQSESRKSRAYQAFYLFATLAERRPGQAKTKPSRMVAEFFDMHILGIMTHFSEIIGNFQGLYSKTERLRCIRAIAEMIIIAKSQVSGALPQIRAALQSSMDHVELCDASFAAWLNLLPVLESNDIGLIVDQTFALILRHWDNFSTELQSKCHERISNLVKNHNQILQENIMTLPSLTGIPLLSKLGGEIERLKANEPVEAHCKAFTRRLGHESKVVVVRALEELLPFLSQNQDFIYDSATSVQPTSVLSELLRALLDATAKYASDDIDAAELSAKALGIIGCLDPDRVEATRKKRKVLVLYNFDRASEVEDWTLVLLEDVLVKTFKSVNNARAQGFLAFVMQELLRFCDFNDGTILRPRASQAPSKHQKWMKLPDNVRIILTPLVNSRYVVMSSGAVPAPNRVYPGFSPEAGHSSWLRSLVYDLMWKAKGENAKNLFPVLARTIRGHDLAIASFMLPYAFLNVVLGGTVAEIEGLSSELLAVLGGEPANPDQWETIKLCSESVFNVLDYMSLWLQEKKKVLGESRATAFKTGHAPNDFDEARDMAQIDTVERFLTVIPADMIANRAIMCGAFARALFNWEQHIRRKRPLIPSSGSSQSSADDALLYDKLFDIYAQIDEPDGLEGISAHLSFLDDSRQTVQHARAGRWTAAQAWYEMSLGEAPHDLDLEQRVLSCFRETGRYEALLKYAGSFLNTQHAHFDEQSVLLKLAPTILEANWSIGDLDGMLDFMEDHGLRPMVHMNDFNVEVARLLHDIRQPEGLVHVSDRIKALRTTITRGMTLANTSSVQAIHSGLTKLHVLHEAELLCNSSTMPIDDVKSMMERRLSTIGSYADDKQFVLGVRRAVMLESSAYEYADIAPLWLTTAKLARQAGNTEHAYNAVLKASGYGDNSAKIEEAKLLWHDGHQRHAIHALENAIASGIFDDALDGSTGLNESNVSTRSATNAPKQNPVAAKVHLMLAKWLDATGQTQTQAMVEKYQRASRLWSRWEKGHYYLGKHYQKLLDAEKALPEAKQSLQYRSGELTKLVVENLVRSIPFGNKYWHETIPKILTLWMDLGSSTIKRLGHEDRSVFDRRVMALASCNNQLSKYLDRVPPYVYYSAVPQMMSRITHPNAEVWKVLETTLARISAAHPSQVLWSLLPVARAKDRTRAERGTEILNRLRDPKTKSKGSDGSSIDLRVLISQAQRLSEGLLRVCDTEIEKHHRPEMRLSEHFGFNHKLAPSQLVVPIETTLSISLPNGANSDTIKRYKAFVQDKVTIQSFAEEVMILSSLMKPRKLTVRGSDGKQYGLMCKPKDDLRKDRRLMEFNGIINRFLKRDAESSKRRLYVKTYAVTPLSEESGIIEWVEGIKPMRDILLNAYGRKGTRPNYNQLKDHLDQACSAPGNAHLFVEKVLSKYPPVLHEWFNEVYPEPDAWFAARLRYARSAAVMSMAGHVLGLGDRHGENILLEESTGGVFHVDFNCLFDKGLTFEKPELVPFRLTHNMVDAMGPYGAEGPFRKSSELTLGLLRQSKDTLMTVLETFLYDPTTDFVEHKKASKAAGVPSSPQEILDSVEGKLKGLWKSERVPLGVEGYVDALIKEATSPFNLASMYLGWCAFL